MTWTSEIDGPIAVPGDPDPVTGEVLTWRPEYHLNAPLALFNANAEAMTPYRIFPASPSRIYAGDLAETVFLRFPDEATARAVLAAFWADPGA